MQLSARTLATWGAVALALTNVARAPAGTLGGRESPLILADLVTLAVCAFLVLGIATGRVRVVVDRITAAVGAFLLLAAVSAVLAVLRYSPGISESLGLVAYLVRWVAYFAWYPFVAWCLTSDDAEAAWRNVERAILAFCIFGIFQSAFLPGFAQMLETETRAWDVQGRRLVSTVLDPNFAGIFIVIALLFRLARFSEGERENGIVLATLAAGLLLTLSRSALLGLLVGLAILAVAGGLRLRLVKVFVAGIVLVLPFISLLLSWASGFNKLGVDASAAQRLIPWTRAVLMIRDHPWFGVGFNAITQAQQARGWRPVGGAEGSLDGGLLFVAAMTGIVGLFFYVRILVRVALTARRAWRDPATPPRDRAHATATVASICAVVVHSLFVNSLLLPFVMQILWTMWGRLAHIAAAQRRRVGAAAALPVLLVLAGCDPCAATASCNASKSDVAVTGTIVHYRTGAAVEGARVEARFDAGAGEVVASSTTSSEGLWTIEARVPGSESVRATFTVIAPGATEGYTTPQLSVRRPATRGDAMNAGLWVDLPSTRFIASVSVDGTLARNAAVRFEPIGGVPGRVEEFSGMTDGRGYIEMFVVGPQVGAVVGTLHLQDPVLGARSLSGVPINLDYRWVLEGPIADLNLRPPRLAYGGAIVFIGTMEHVAGAVFEFRRTGGVDITPRQFSAVTGPDGYFYFEAKPLGTGEVIGDVTIRPPAGTSNAEPRVYRDIRLATFDSLYSRHAGLWGYGEAWNWYVDVVRASDGQPAANVPIEFRRTGGVMIEPQVISGRTGASGRFAIRAAVRDTGVVIGDLVISPPDGAQVRRELRLETKPDVEFHSAGTISYTPTTP